jgi:hypothetical protein
MNDYEQALALYQGEYLAEDLYEERTIAPRERWLGRLTAMPGSDSSSTPLPAGVGRVCMGNLSLGQIG